jgi:phenylalanyl-tRNA synthetase beta chain
MRSSLLGGLLLALGRNLSYGKQHLALFEAGHSFEKAHPEAQSQKLAGIRQGRQNHHWQGNSTTDLWKIKADMLSALAACGLRSDSLRYEDTPPAYFHPSKAGVVKLGNKTLAAFGELHPSVLAKLDVEAPCAAFEINMECLPPIKSKNKKTQKTDWQAYIFIPVRRDFAFIVDKTLSAETLIKAAAEPLKKIKHNIKLFDLFENEQALGADKKSMAVEIELLPPHVMTDEEIDSLATELIDSVETKTGGKLRG